MAKKEEIDLKEIDANFIISSFKNKERRNNPSSIPRPLSPESEKELPEEKKETTVVPSEAQREETKRKRSKAPDYESLFIQEVGITARTGKSV